MAILDNLLKAKWQHSDPEVRLAAAASLDDESVLAEIVRSDLEAKICETALKRIESPEVLDGLIDSLAPPLQAMARQQRLKQLLPNPDRIGSIKDDVVLVRIVSLSDDAALNLSAINNLSSEDVRHRVAQTHTLAKVRLAAAQGISDLEKLHQLLDFAQGKDKALYRYCKDQLNGYKAIEQERTRIQEQITLIIEKAANLATEIDSPEYEATYRLLASQWEELRTHVSKADQERIEKDLKICTDRVDIKIAELIEEEQRQGKLVDAEEAIKGVIGELSKLRGNTDTLNDKASISELERTLIQIVSRWEAANKQMRASHEQVKIYENELPIWQEILKTSRRALEKRPALKKLRRDLETVDKTDYLEIQRVYEHAAGLTAQLSWPQTHNSKRPEVLIQLKQYHDQLLEVLDCLQQHNNKNTERLKKAMANLIRSLDDNCLKEASREHALVLKALKPLPKHVQQQQEKILRPLTSKLEEIRDWQSFAIEPKKLALCEAMEALVDADLNSDVLAEKIHALHEEWKQLGQINPPQEQALQKRFRVAGNRAFEPCRKAFSENAVLRQENLARRMKVVDEMLEYERVTDWDSAAVSGDFDWRAVLKYLDSIRTRFRGIKPVGHKDERISEKALKNVGDKIYEHVSEEYDRNIEARKKVIERAIQLMEVDDLEQAIDEAKRLQKSWNGIGITPKRVDRRLWKKFRAACDAIFKRLEEQKQQNKAEVNSTVEQAENIVRQVRELIATEDDKKLLRLPAELRESQEVLRELDLPKGAQQRFVKQLNRLEEQARKIASDVRLRQKNEGWIRLSDKLNACLLKESDQKAAALLWERAGDLPKGVDSDLLSKYWEKGSAKASDEEKLCRLCIAVEILANIESPPSDAKVRMAYQVECLAANMGKPKEDPHQTLVKLANEWIELRPAGVLTERFLTGLRNAFGQ